MNVSFKFYYQLKLLKNKLSSYTKKNWINYILLKKTLHFISKHYKFLLVDKQKALSSILKCVCFMSQ